MSSTGPGDAQGDRAKRYDRQLRIWGAHGQQRLEACKVLLLNSGPTGSETLKNLVLGGIASFTIVDGAKVTPQDVGNNFMLHVQHVGQSRAKCVTDLLYELNDGVCGSYVEETPEALLDTNPAFVSSFGLVIATQMAEQALVKLDNACRQHGVKLLIARSYGLVGYVRASLPEHRIVETKPDTQVDDLRILSPWPDLLQWATSFDVPALDDITHRHLPYVVLLIQAAQAWVHQRGSPPATSKERAEFKALLAAQKRVVDGIPLDEDNFDEAVKHAFHAWSLPSSGSGGAAVALPSEVVALLADDAAQVTPKSDDFWVLVAALRAFVGWDEQQQGSAGAVTSTSGGGGSGGGLRSGGGGRCLRPLPLEGSIPDMTSTTDLYLQLQRLYRDKAEADVAALAGHVRTILASLGRDKESISTEAIRHFAKNARNLQVRPSRCCRCPFCLLARSTAGLSACIHAFEKAET